MVLTVIRSPSPVPYREALQRQKALHALRAAGTIGDTLWLLEHPPVITTGLRGEGAGHVLVDPASVGVEVVETERGGLATYHGPGQLVGYLFVGIAGFGFQVRRFVEAIEESFIRYLARDWGVAARHDAEHTGVWVGRDKIVAIGLALRSRTTFHGFAFNVHPDLSHFGWIVPCGIADRGVTSLAALVGETPSLDAVGRRVAAALAEGLGYEGVRDGDVPG